MDCARCFKLLCLSLQACVFPRKPMFVFALHINVFLGNYVFCGPTDARFLATAASLQHALICELVYNLMEFCYKSVFPLTNRYACLQFNAFLDK